MLTKRSLQNLFRVIRGGLAGQGFLNPRVDKIISDLKAQSTSGAEGALFNFTIDFELCWGNAKRGVCDIPFKERVEAAKIQAENFFPFVELLEELNFPISWAVLGRLAHSEDRLAPEHKFAPPWARSDWYKKPSNAEVPSEYWDGKTYLETLKKRLPFCEILSHGYAHIDYSDPTTTADIAENDLKLSKSALEEFGFDVSGFVYPCNRQGYLELLNPSGYFISRGSDQDWHFLPNLIQTPLGFWMSPGVMSFKDVSRVIDQGICSKAYIHPWIHLIECSLKCNDLKNFYRPLFEKILEEQARGRIRNVSFSEIRKLNLHDVKRDQSVDKYPHAGR